VKIEPLKITHVRYTSAEQGRRMPTPRILPQAQAA
jgi:hypothetical protein